MGISTYICSNWNLVCPPSSPLKTASTYSICYVSHRPNIIPISFQLLTTITCLYHWPAMLRPTYHVHCCHHACSSTISPTMMGMKSLVTWPWCWTASMLLLMLLGFQRNMQIQHCGTEAVACASPLSVNTHISLWIQVLTITALEM